MRKVVITGVGAVSPFGHAREDFFKGISEARSATKRLSLFRDDALSSQVAAEVPDFDPEKILGAQEARRVPRVVPMAILAARQAFADAGLGGVPAPGERPIGVIVGTGGGGIEFAEKQYESFFAKGDRHVTPYSVSSSFVGMLSSEISIALGLRGPSHVVSTGCTSSTDAIGYAYRCIRWGVEDILLTGGAEACITRGILAGFCRMKVVASRFNDSPESASRPFDRDRDGFVLGEGAWMFVLESEESAKRRGTRIYGEVAGYGSTCEAHHRVMIREDAVEPARAMRLALEESGVFPDAVQVVSLHGTATAMNDRVETKAVKLLFGKHAARLATSSLKSMIGHPQGACGAASVAAAVLTLRDQFVTPTINYRNPDPECDLDYTPNTGKERDVETLICNTIAFGSKNSALVLKRWEN